MNLASLGLNLPVALRALLEERNVTRAGERVGLSQPAMSAALARLRRHFGDELPVRNGNRYELTPLGTVPHARAQSAYAMLERLFTSRADFRPATERHAFTLLSSDYAVAVFGAEPAVELCEDEWVCLVAADHPEVGDRITLDDLARLPWVVYRRPFDAPVTRRLSMLGLEPYVDVSVPSFQLLPGLVSRGRGGWR